VWPLQTLIPGGFHSHRQAAKISRRKFPWSLRRRRPPQSLCAIITSSPEPSCHRRVLPRTSASSFLTTVEALRCLIFPDLSRWRRWPRRRPPQVHNAVPKPATMSSSLSPQRCAPLALPGPAALSSSLHTRRLEPATPSNLRHSWARNTVVLLSPQGYIVYFSLLFWAYKSWFWYATLPHCFDMLHCFCSAALLWCATLLWYATFSLTCHISLICYIVFDMLHFFDMLHHYITLICYIARFLWYATLFWCATLPHCFDMLHFP
jgi:hypothetical protein